MVNIKVRYIICAHQIHFEQTMLTLFYLANAELGCATSARAGDFPARQRRRQWIKVSIGSSQTSRGIFQYIFFVAEHYQNDKLTHINTTSK